MKKRLCALTLALALFTALPALAAGPEETAAETHAVSLSEVADLVRAGSFLLRSYDELIAAVDETDRAQAYEDLLEANNGLTDVVWLYIQAGETGAALLLRQQQETIKDQLEDYKPENYPRTYADLVKPVELLENQLVLGAENLYLRIAALGQDVTRAELGLTQLERAVQETRLLCSFGRASAFACLQAEAARDAAARQLEALTGQYDLLTAQFGFLIGQAAGQALTFAPVTPVTQEELSAMAYDTDLQAGLELSCAVYLAQSAVTDAEQTWDDTEHGWQKDAAERRYNAAVYALEAERESFRQAFDGVFRGVETAQNAVAAAGEALSFQQQSCDAASLRYKLGLISRSALLTAQAGVSAAEAAVQASDIALAAACNSYRWARLGVIIPAG